MRALVREGSDAMPLSEQGVEIVRGDLVDPASLEPALDGMDALVTTAAGYVRRRKGDSLRFPPSTTAGTATSSMRRATPASAGSCSPAS